MHILAVTQHLVLFSTPNRVIATNLYCNILMIHFVAAEADKRLPYSYVLAPQNVQAGDAIVCGPTAPIRPGNSLPLRSIPLGTPIHNIELIPGKGGQIARAAGTSATLVSKGELDVAVHSCYAFQFSRIHGHARQSAKRKFSESAKMSNEIVIAS